MAAARISRIEWKKPVTPTEAAFLTEWVAIRQGWTPLTYVPELPRQWGHDQNDWIKYLERVA